MEVVGELHELGKSNRDKKRVRVTTAFRSTLNNFD